MVTLLDYDPFGRRVAELVDAVHPRMWVWSENELCEERAPDGRVLRRFTGLSEEILSGADAGIR